MMNKVNALRQEFAWRVSDAQYDDYVDTFDEKQMASIWSYRWQVAQDMIADYFMAMICKFRGHDYKPDGRDYPEDGGEGFSCERCGHSFMAWH